MGAAKVCENVKRSEHRGIVDMRLYGQLFDSRSPMSSGFAVDPVWSI
jgi:hypothetical protein